MYNKRMWLSVAIVSFISFISCIAFGGLSLTPNPSMWLASFLGSLGFWSAWLSALIAYKEKYHG